MTAYYNEIDPYCAEWLRNLAAEGLIPPGEVDERSIEDVKPDEIKSFTQAHFFAGIGGWPLAARLAGWPDDRPLWTGSCPCPPFSNAGKRKICPECGWANPVPCPARTGYFLCCECEHQWHADDRHLWPELWRLIRDRRPPVVVGEQVASPDGRVWLAGVRGTLEILGYAVGGSDLCAAGVGAPHIRQRLWWVADAECGAAERHGHEMAGATRGMQEAPREQRIRDNSGDGCSTGRLGDATWGGRPGERGSREERIAESGSDCRVEQSDGAGRSTRGLHIRSGRSHEAALFEPWAGAEWIGCGDGKERRIKPGIEPLVDGFSGRVDQVRAYGNAIVPQEAAEFLTAFMESA